MRHKDTDSGSGGNPGGVGGPGAALPSSSSSLSTITRNRKLTAAAGAILIVIGAAGMVLVGADVLQTIRQQGAVGAEYQQAQYVFLFTMIAGLVLLIYSAVSMQAERAKARRENSNNSNISP